MGFQGQIAEMLCKDLEKVTWKKNEKEFVFYRSTFINSIQVNLESNSPSELIVTIQMPKKELEIEDNNLLSIGVETGTKSSSVNRPMTVSSGSMQGRSGGGGGGRGGGMGSGSGKGRGGMSSGMQPGSGQGANRGQISTQPFKFWFQVQL